MKKRNLLLTALCLASVSACAIGATACNTKPEHSHSWSAWTVTDTNKPSDTQTGKATRTCSNDGCNATATDKEHSLPALTSTDYSKSADTATCMAGGSVTYTYNKDGVNVNFDIATQINSDNHDYGAYVKTDAEGHYKVCTRNGEHKTQKEAHNTNGTDGACSVCGYKATVTPPPETHTHTPSITWVNTDPTQHYKLCTDNDCPNPTEKIQAAAHDTNGTDGACSVCNYKASTTEPDPEEPTATINGTGTATVKVGGGNSARIDAYSLATGYYTFTYEGNDPITIAYNYYVLGTGAVSDTVTLSWEGEHSFTAELSSKATCSMAISSTKAIPFNATITMTFSDTDPRPAKTLNLGTATEVKATYAGVVYEYTATAAGSYTLECTDNKAVIWLADNDTPITLPYTFTLAENEKISFVMGCNDINNPNATYNVTLSSATVTPTHNHSWGDWTVTEGNKPTLTATGKATRTCTGTGDCNAEATDKEYTLPALTSDDYTLTDNTATVNGNGTGTYTYNKNDVSVSFTAETPAIDSQTFTITVTGAGSGVTVKLGKYSATTNAQGVATVKAEKQSYDVIVEKDRYSFTAATVTIANPTVTVKLPVFVEGNTDAERIGQAGTLSGAGLYTTTITAKADEEIADKYTISERYFLFSCGDTAKTYTVKILSINTTISPEEAGYVSFTGVGESYSIVLEEGDSTIFGIASNDENIAANYSYKVVFEITESEAPAAGGIERPIRIENNVQSTTAVSSATQKVYYRLDNATFGRYATITFGADVTVYSIGYSKTGEATQISSGDIIDVSEHNYAYIYAVSTGANCVITAQAHYPEGDKNNPYNVTLGADNTPAFDVEKGIREQWYKVQASEEKTYIFKPDANHAILEIYTDLDGEAYKTVSGGSSVTLQLTANTPYYIKASSTLNESYNFVVRIPTDDDKGASAEAPFELTETGDYVVNDGNFYYEFTPTVNSKVVISYNGGVSDSNNYLILYVSGTQAYDYTNLIASSLTNNKVEFLAVAGTTYYFQTAGGEAQLPTFHFETTALEAHDYNIYVTDGTNTYNNVTVTVMKNGEVVTGASATTDSNGKVTLSLVPDNYTIVLSNLPTGYGYFADYSVLTINNDNETDYEVKLYVLQDYSFTVKLPNGNGAQGITVTFTNKVTGTFTAVTNADGVATIKQIPPMVVKNDGTIGTGGNYAVTFELLDSLSEDYTYVGGSVSLTAANPTSEIALTNLFAYVLTLVDSDGNHLGEGIEVKLLSGSTVMATTTTNASGVAIFTEKVIAGEYTIILSDDYITTVNTSATVNEMTVTCSAGGIIVGGGSKAPVTVLAGESLIQRNGSTTAYFKFTPETAGKYTVTLTGASYFSNVILDSTAAADRIIIKGAVSTTKESDITVVNNESNFCISFTVTINDYIIFSPNDNGTYTISINEVVIVGGGSKAPVSITQGTNTIQRNGSSTAYFKFAPVTAGKYTITITGTSLYNIMLDSTAASDRVIAAGNLSTTKESDATFVGEEGNYTSITLTISEYVVISPKDNGKFTITITPVTE